MLKLLVASLSLLALCACSAPTVQHRAGVLEYLYPEGAPTVPPSDVHLALPLRVGVAFAPGGPSGESYGNYWTGELGAYSPSFSEGDKQRLLERVAAAFQGTEGVQSIQIVPASYLQPRGGFANVDQLRSLLGLDLIAILSYEQTQFQDLNRASLTYWTVVGAYFVEGNENETHTFVDTSVFDIPSRALLFNAAGRSKVGGSATALETAGELRSESRDGFDQAVDAMIVQLQGALAAFREQAKAGTVRGAGTPKLEVTREGGGSGAGAAGALELALALLLTAGCALGRRGAA